jgi:hypothetical protein
MPAEIEKKFEFGCLAFQNADFAEAELIAWTEQQEREKQQASERPAAAPADSPAQNAVPEQNGQN